MEFMSARFFFNPRNIVLDGFRLNLSHEDVRQTLADEFSFDLYWFSTVLLYLVYKLNI
jgi:hypothetical protein